MRRLGPVAALLLALTACGGGDPGGGASPTATTTTPAGTPSGTPSPAASGPRCALPPVPPSGTTIVTATVTGGRVETAQRRYDVRLGSPVRIDVTTDVPDEVHVHGYDLRKRTVPGCAVVIDFEATIPGSVEVELESSHVELFELRAR